MAFTLWALLEAGLLIVNAICVLHEQRFLAKGKRILKPILNLSENISELLLINYDNEYDIFSIIYYSWLGI